MKKSGISLITLIIIIIVLIILSFAVIFAISNNNPINSAKVLTLAETRESINESLGVYINKIKTDTSGKYNTTQILLGNRTTIFEYKIATNEDFCYIEDEGTYKKVYKLDSESSKEKAKAELKMIDNNSEWYVDDEGIVYLLYNSEEDIPSYLKSFGVVVEAVSSFVKVKVDASEIQTGELKTATISFENNTVSKTYGNRTFINLLTNTGDGLVIFDSSNEGVAEINSFGSVEIIGAGTTTITATVEDSLNYTYAIKEASYVLTVTPKSVSIPLSPLDKVYDGTSKNHGINIPEGAEIVSSESTISAVEPGEYTVVVKLSNENYIWSNDTSTNKNVTWKIIDLRPSASISFNQATVEKIYGDEAFTNDLTNTGDGIVTYSSSNENVAQINSYGIVEVKHVGQTTITATVSDTVNYKYPIKEVSYVLTVSPKQVEVPISPEDKTYDGTSKSHGIVIQNGAEIVSAESTISAIEPGEYTVVVKLSNENYIWSNGTNTNKNVTWKIIDLRGEASISFRHSSIEKEYGDALFTNYLTNTGDGTVTYTSLDTSIATINEYGIVSIVGSGTATIRATVSDTINYKYPTKVIEYTLTVSQKSVGIPESPADKAYTGTIQSHGISIPSGVEIVTSGSTLSAIDAGTYTVVVKLSNSNYIWNDGTTANKSVTWKIYSVTLTLDANGGTIGSSSTTTISVAPGSTITIPTVTVPTSANYKDYTGTITLDGWYTAAVGGEKIQDPTVMPETSQTWYAHYTPEILDLYYTFYVGLQWRNYMTLDKEIGDISYEVIYTNTGDYTNKTSGYAASSITFENVDTNKEFYLSYDFQIRGNGPYHASIGGTGLIDNTNKCIRTCRPGALYSKFNGVESCTDVANDGITNLGVRFNFDDNNYTKKAIFNARNKKDNPTIVYRLIRNGAITISAYANGGTISNLNDWTGTVGNTSVTKSINVSDSFGTLPEVQREGYTFNGWYTQENGGKQVLTTDNKVSSGTSFIYAHWTAN